MTTRTTQPARLVAALRYAAFGWRVFPCAWVLPDGSCSCGRDPCPDKPGKHPLYARPLGLTRGCKDATADPVALRRWWCEWPDANPAVATGQESGVWVLGPDGELGVLQLNALAADHADEFLPESPTARTGSGGSHLYFRWPSDGLPLSNRANHRGLKIDVRGAGGYVIAPPGVNANGRYEWLTEPGKVTPPEAPAWLLEWVRGRDEVLPARGREWSPGSIHPYGRKALESEAGAVEKAGEGTRHSVLVRAAFKCGQLVAGGAIPRQDAEAALSSAAASAGLPEGEVARTVRDGIEAGSHFPRTPPDRNGDHPRPRVATATEPPDHGPAELEVSAVPWPAPLGVDALHGLAGDVVRAIDPHTEADPAAILFQFLVGFGNMAGRNAYYRVESSRHYPNLFAVLVGQSSRARKGTSWQRALRVLERGGDEAWANRRVVSGLSSGEGLIWEVRDAVSRRQPIRQGGQTTGHETVEVDPGVEDKRVLVIEEEFASVLQVGKREGNILGSVLRSAWDTGKLGSLTKSSPARSTGAHISVISHITRTELLTMIHTTQAHNGFLNRFLWAAVRRSKLLPYGGLDVNLDRLAADLECAHRFASAGREVAMSSDARELWGAEYARLTADRPGLFGAVTSRAEAQTLRLALVYALLDCSETIEPVHLRAALAVEKYVEESARNIFGDMIGEPVADEIRALLKASPNGITQTQIVDHFARNRTREELQRALSQLLELGYASRESAPTGKAGRPPVVWKHNEINEKNEEIPRGN